MTLIKPSISIDLLSSLKQKDVMSKFSDALNHVESFNIVGSRKPSFREYEGHINNESILFRRILKRGANSFIPKATVPKATATVKPNKSGTSIQIKFVFQNIPLWFLNAFRLFMFLVIVLLVVNLKSVPNGTNPLLFFGIFTFMLFFLEFIPRLALSYEVYRFEKDFRKRLACTVKKPRQNTKLNIILEKVFDL